MLKEYRLSGIIIVLCIGIIIGIGTGAGIVYVAMTPLVNTEMEDVDSKDGV